MLSEPEASKTEALWFSGSRRLASIFVLAAAVCSCQTAAPVSKAIAAPDQSGCRNMEGLSSIPPGYHPVTAQWRGDTPTVDLVCIVKTEGIEIDVLAWKGFALPSDYHVLYSDSTMNTTFRGCSQWSQWQGMNNCMNSWPSSHMRKN
jgi:hypothetical protein